MYEQNQLSERLNAFADEILKSLEAQFKQIDDTAEYNQLKVLDAMQKNRLSDAHFQMSTGYGYNDTGRDTLEAVYADIFNTEDALVRPQIMSGTHALNIALSGNLRPGDKMLYISGKPYDTLEEVIGIRPGTGSLAEYGISYGQVDLADGGEFDFEGIRRALDGNVKLVAIQRSRGYSSRPSLSADKIGKVIRFVKEARPDVAVMVDNCYGEFVERLEPSDVGADLTVGSLTKNPGGGLAPAGGYIAGKKECVYKCACRLSAPGLGKETGANLGVIKSLFQGLFIAPSVTAAALKGAVFSAAVYERLGFKVSPASYEPRYDIVQSVDLKTPQALITFCKGIQKASPVDSFAVPEPWEMPGYDEKVIMAAGAFVQGSSIELSADAPLKPPYTVYFQGGLTWHHAKYGILRSVQELINEGIVHI